jgi:two-component system chemotaxis response regulator CheB
VSGPIVCIGASWGGVDALRTVLGALPCELPAPVCIVQHRGEERGLVDLADSLQKATPLRVCEPEDKQPLTAGYAYLAPPGYHLMVNGEHMTLSMEGRVRWSRPSVDVLFESAAAARGSDVVAVVLTGANDDGARGARAVHDAGGAVIVQDPGTAERGEMPRAAVELGIPDVVLPLEEIADEIRRRVGEAGGA